MADTLGMYTDDYLISLWLCSLARVPADSLVLMLVAPPQRYGPRARA